MSMNSLDDNQIKLDPLLSPLFSKATEILFCTGNTLALGKMMNKTNVTVTQEILKYISTILQTTRAEVDVKQFQDETYVKFLPPIDETSVINNYNGATSDQEEIARQDLKFSVKMFLCSLEPQLLSHTIDTVLDQLQETYLESVLISIPHSATQTTLNDFLPLWRIIEDYIDKQKILSAGVCDFMLPLLSDLCNSARHKPYANQINLGVCWSIPEELNKYAKENNIQLLTHNDPLVILSESDFQEAMRTYCHEYDSNNWKPLSIVRYNSLISNRGIIKSKGYFIYAQRELRMN